MTRINYIFIDFENVQGIDWDRIIDRPARVTLVLGEQHKYIPVSVVRKMLKCAGQIELIETKRTGKNAADFVLAQLIGDQKKSDPHGYFHVVSKDKGFDALIEHLKENGILAARRASFSDIPVLMNNAERVKSLGAYLKEHPTNRPAKLKSLTAQIQAIFGKALSPDEVTTTVQGLIAAKAISVSEGHGISYRI